MITGWDDSGRPRPGVANLNQALTELGNITSRLRWIGAGLLGVVLAQVILTWWTFVVVFPIRPVADYTLSVFTGFTASLSALALAIFFDRTRREGDDLFNVISDQLQSRDSLAPIDLRLRMREFVRASELPLAPARTGLLVYLLISVSLLFFQTWLVIRQP
jgi:hypothetical protein